MKTKFTINREIFSTTKEDGYSRYEMFYKEEGWELCKDKEEVFMIFNKEINLNEGDRVYIHEFRIVTWKCFDIINDFIEYSLEQE
jgi:hypothetical protein